jgi:hypothetical protein
MGIGIKHSGRAVEHAPSSVSEVKELYLHSPMRLHDLVFNCTRYFFIAWYFFKHRGNFTFRTIVVHNRSKLSEINMLSAVKKYEVRGMHLEHSVDLEADGRTI